jgi:membrane-bound lytic murein transglycosylase F
MKTIINIIVLCSTLFLSSCMPKSESKVDVVLNENIKDSLEIDSLDSGDIPKIRKRVLRKVKKYKDVIQKYSTLYRVDWRLAISIIRRESNFNENAISHMGAVGLMQIMPITEEDIKRDIEYDYINHKPEENIAAGLLHLSKLLDYYSYIQDETERTKLALATYNAGLGHIIDASSICKTERLNPNKWENIRASLAKLTREHYEVHLDVWSAGKPRYGYFKNYIETVTYVDKIWYYYQEFKIIFQNE